MGRRFSMATVLKIAVPVPVRRAFDYLPPEAGDSGALRPGMRIEVPFGRGKKVGVLLDVVEESDLDPAKLKPALAVLDEVPLLSDADLKLLAWASRYYHYPLGEAVAAAFSATLRRGESATPETIRRLCPAGLISPDAEDAVKRAPRQSALLHKLWEAPEGLTPAALAELDGNWRNTAAALVGKGLAVWRECAAAPFTAAGAAPPPTRLRLNAHQETAVAAVTEALGGYRAFLLEGVTGSGKTEVYLRVAQEVLARGGQTMILLPEISLTPQLEARFRARFAAPVVVYHSALNDNERRRAWLAMQRGEAAILLGTRSAVFTPLRAPGLIVLDEEHDTSFKQHDGFRYSARDVAVMRANLLNIPVLLGSATPSLETLHNARLGRYHWLRLPERAGGAAEPTFRLLDIRGQRLTEGISGRLAADIKETLARGEQALLFVNRRGFAPTLICHACGWVAQCRHCDANLVIHYGEQKLRCHHCGFEQALGRQCGDCKKEELRPLGLGTERIEAVLGELFPAARVARIDRDSTRRKGQLQRLLEDVCAGRIDLLIGTQMLAKGHHFPGVTLVGIVDVDAGLYSTDFRAGERTAQLVMQVAGRAGREERPGTVVLQTRHPEHPLLRRLVGKGYPAFAAATAEEREAALLPPYSHQALWRAEANQPDAPRLFLQGVAELAGRLGVPALLVLGPAPAPLARRAGWHRWQLLLQSEKRGVLHNAIDRLLASIMNLEESRRVRWSIDVDPVDLY
ncbi:primosomal protein N' [Methylomagnum sp.]